MTLHDRPTHLSAASSLPPPTGFERSCINPLANHFAEFKYSSLCPSSYRFQPLLVFCQHETYSWDPNQRGHLHPQSFFYPPHIIAQPAPRTFHVPLLENWQSLNNEQPTWRALDASSHIRQAAGNECFLNGGRTAAILAGLGPLEGPNHRIPVGILGQLQRKNVDCRTRATTADTSLEACLPSTTNHTSPYNMTSDAGEDGKSSLQSQSPDESADADTADMAERADTGAKPTGQSQPGNGQPKSASNAKDPTRPRRKKARRACYACQRAHLTCGECFRFVLLFSAKRPRQLTGVGG